VRGSTLSGDLVLVGSGDFSFGLREQAGGKLGYNNTPEIDHNYADTGLPGPTILKGSDPLVGLDDLARKVRAAGIRQVNGNVVVDDRLFETYDGWPDGLLSPIWVNENVIDITTRPTQAGRPAKVDWRPKTAAVRVESTVRTVAQGAKPLTVSESRPGVVQISGRIAAGSAPILSISHIADPAAFARTAFIEALGRAGVRVTAGATGPNPTALLPKSRSYPAATRVAERVSLPLSEYVKVILKVSYNRGADLMICLVAVVKGSRSCIEGLRTELATITRLGVSAVSTILFDGAGSSEFDRSSPSDFTTFLRNAVGQPWGAALRDGLPILGVDGTFATNQRGTPAAGHVFVKSGTRGLSTPTDEQVIFSALTQVGYIDAKSGRKLAYSLFLRDLPVTNIEDFTAADADEGAIAAAIQQGY
jgi:D-alanyl-D-alanine carboxypeptidase/D-alanyl-D-alanine-endopeptidase (penicillin-binding protein 4)